MRACWGLFLGIIATTTLVTKVSTSRCLFAAITDNSVVGGISDIYCLTIPESSKKDTIVCSLQATNAETITLNFSGSLSNYNKLETVLNEDNTKTVNLIMIQSYSSYVDTANPSSDTIQDTFTCTSSDNQEISTWHIFVTITPENTEKPMFTSGPYTFIDVPENTAVGIDITCMGYGPPIIAEDKDNDFSNGEEYLGSKIIFVVEEESEEFQVQTVAQSTEWPFAYRAQIFIMKPLDYNVEHNYSFNLIAKNADDKTDQKSTTNIVVLLKDIDNLDPIFSSGYYTTIVEENMVSTIGGYNLAMTPELEAHDQDTGINEPLIYAIDPDCGNTTECYIVNTFFKIEKDTGHIIFVSFGSWPEPNVTTVSFLITATQDDNPLKLASAEVIANIQVPKAPSSR